MLFFSWSNQSLIDINRFNPINFHLRAKRLTERHLISSQIWFLSEDALECTRCALVRQDFSCPQSSTTNKKELLEYWKHLLQNKRISLQQLQCISQNSITQDVPIIDMRLIQGTDRRHNLLRKLPTKRFNLFKTISGKTWSFNVNKKIVIFLIKQVWTRFLSVQRLSAAYSLGKCSIKEELLEYWKHLLQNKRT